MGFRNVPQGFRGFWQVSGAIQRFSRSITSGFTGLLEVPESFRGVPGYFKGVSGMSRGFQKFQRLFEDFVGFQERY